MQLNTIFYNGRIYTANLNNSMVNAIWIKDGIIQQVGDYEELKVIIESDTEHYDLQNKIILPGIIDSHMHPFWGGKQINGYHLNYDALTIDELLSKVQSFLDAEQDKGADEWLKVTAWQRQSMIPEGTDLDNDILDRLNTVRPIVVFANDCHTLVANSRALELLGLNPNMTDPPDGKIRRNEAGELNGVLEDAPAMRAFDSIKVQIGKSNVEIAREVQNLLNQQGVTTIMDARVFEEHLDAFGTLQANNELTVRVLGAREVTPEKAKTNESIEETFNQIVEFINTYHNTIYSPQPGIHIHHIKFFIDGVLQSPITTASLLQPYNLKNIKTGEWEVTNNYGDLYFTQNQLELLFRKVADLKLHPHCHTVGEGAINSVLRATQKIRNEYPDLDFRPGLAHNELVAEHQFEQFKLLDAIPVLSFQWSGLTEEMAEQERKKLGDERFINLEPIAKFIDRGVKIAYGSDWPIDRLDEWYNLQVGITRQIWDTDADQLAGPVLDNDRGLSIFEAINAATINAAFMLGMEKYIGSLEVGKFADLIILENDLFNFKPEEVFKTKIEKTVVGGKIVFTNQ
ncbi:amidohydrolase [Thorsellia kenyensis]|uniref:Amidohydrolase n=1 Tax=Thorsellia kenyensis TaxID=1549888 RepID=A0ABV6C936_9GAMM